MVGIGRYKNYINCEVANAKLFQFWESKKMCFSTFPTEQAYWQEVKGINEIMVFPFLETAKKRLLTYKSVQYVQIWGLFPIF